MTDDLITSTRQSILRYDEAIAGAQKALEQNQTMRESHQQSMKMHLQSIAEIDAVDKDILDGIAHYKALRRAEAEFLVKKESGE